MTHSPQDDAPTVSLVTPVPGWACPPWCATGHGHDLAPGPDGTVRRWHTSAPIALHRDGTRDGVTSRVTGAELECFETVPPGREPVLGPVHIRTEAGAWPLDTILTLAATGVLR